MVSLHMSQNIGSLCSECYRLLSLSLVCGTLFGLRRQRCDCGMCRLICVGLLQHAKALVYELIAEKEMQVRCISQSGGSVLPTDCLLCREVRGGVGGAGYVGSTGVLLPPLGCSDGFVFFLFHCRTPSEVIAETTTSVTLEEARSPPR